MRRGLVMMARGVWSGAGCGVSTARPPAEKSATKSETRPVTTTATTKDLDVAEIRKWFGDPHVNTGVPEDDALRVLEDFGKAGEPADWPRAGAGEAVGVGALYEGSQKGASGDGFIFLPPKSD